MRPAIIGSLIALSVIGVIVGLRFAQTIPGLTGSNFYYLALMMSLFIGIGIGHLNGVWFARNKTKGVEEFTIF